MRETIHEDRFLPPGAGCASQKEERNGMRLQIVQDFGTGDIETIEISPAALAIEVDPRMAGEVDRILMIYSVPGRFAWITEPFPGRFSLDIDEFSDLDRIGEALLEIAELGGDDPSAVRALIRDLHRRREETIEQKEADSIDDEIALGLYGDDEYL